MFVTAVTSVCLSKRMTRSTKPRWRSSTKDFRVERVACSSARRTTSTSWGARSKILEFARDARPRALDHTDALVDAALVDGFSGLRMTAELTRIPAHGEWQKIVWFDAMVNE